MMDASFGFPSFAFVALFMVLAALGVAVIATVLGIAQKNRVTPEQAAGLSHDERSETLQANRNRYAEEQGRILTMIEQGTITAADADRLFDSLERETTTMSCPYCAEEIRVEAAKCKHCNQFLAQTHPTGSRILTKTHDKVLAGVCGGLAEHFNVDPTLVRALTAVGIIVTGFTGLIVYLIFAMVMPQPESVVTGP